MRVGIDLGTTYSSIAYINEEGLPTIIKNEMDKVSTPSIVAFTDETILFGEQARELQALGSQDVVSAFKRYMGKPDILITYNGIDYTAEKLSSLFLEHIVINAEAKIGTKIDEAVITVPAYFDDAKRKETIQAGEEAGLKVLKIVNEPTAAAFSYGIQHDTDGKIMVYDLGGGTFDITLFDIKGECIKVIATGGNSALGGKDWDYLLMDYVCDLFVEEFGEDPRDDSRFKNELLVEIERYKQNLSVAEKIMVRINYAGNRGVYPVTRDDFESITKSLVDSTISICESVLKEKDLTWESFDSILLTGGSTRMPAIKKALNGITKTRVIVHEDTDVAVAKGAALFAESTGGTLSIGSSKQTNGGKLRQIVISDVTAHSLGTVSISPDGKKYINEIILRRNSPIPSQQRKPFRIEPGNRTDHIEIYTLQGEEKAPLDCTILAKVVASGIQNNGSGLNIDIEYSYDENGVVGVKAYQDNKPLTIAYEPIPEDVSWMGLPPEKSQNAVSLHISMSLDTSGSMAGNPLLMAVKAMERFIDMIPNAFFSITVFASRGKILAKHVSADKAAKTVRGISTEYGWAKHDVGSGTSWSPFVDIGDCFRKGDKEEKKYAIVLTDGQWYASNEDPVKESAKRISEGIDVIAIGFGDADEHFLRTISNTDESGLTNLSNLEAKFSTIATSISSGLSIKKIK